MSATHHPRSMDYETPEMVRSSAFPKKGSSPPTGRKGSKTKDKKLVNYPLQRDNSDQQQQPHTTSATSHHPPDMQQHLEQPMNIPMGTSPQMAHIPAPRPTHPTHHRPRSRQHSEDIDKNGYDKKTRGRVRIRMEFISNKLRRYTTFSKRKTGIMKKAYELSTLTGTQVMLLVASETGHVYTFATPKLQPMITSETGKALIQTCLNSPDPPPPNRNPDERMSQTGYEETELAYPVPTEEGDSKGPNDRHLYSTSDINNSPTHSFGGLNMPHSSFPMNMGFLPSTTTKQGDTNNTMAGPGYTVQQQIGTFSNLFPPPTTYANSIPPQNMTNMSHNMTTHMIRLPSTPGHAIDIGNMVALNRGSSSVSTGTTTTTSDNTTTYIYTSAPATQVSSQDTKPGHGSSEIKHDNSDNTDNRNTHDSNSSL